MTDKGALEIVLTGIVGTPPSSGIPATPFQSAMSASGVDIELGIVPPPIKPIAPVSAGASASASAGAPGKRAQSHASSSRAHHSSESSDGISAQITDEQRAAVQAVHSARRRGIPLWVPLTVIPAIGLVTVAIVSLTIMSSNVNTEVQKRTIAESESNLRGVETFITGKIAGIEKTAQFHSAMFSTGLYDPDDPTSISRAMLNDIQRADHSFIAVIEPVGHIVGSTAVMSDTEYSTLTQEPGWLCVMNITDLDDFTIGNEFFRTPSDNISVTISGMLSSPDMFKDPPHWSGVFLQGTATGAVPEICWSENVYVNGSLFARITVGFFVFNFDRLLDGVKVANGAAFIVSAYEGEYADVVLGGTEKIGISNLTNAIIRANETNNPWMIAANDAVVARFGSWGNIPAGIGGSAATTLFVTPHGSGSREIAVSIARIVRSGLNITYVVATIPNTQSVPASAYGTVGGITLACVCAMLLVSFSVTIPLGVTARVMRAVSMLDFRHRDVTRALSKCRAPSSFIDEIAQINTSAEVLANGAQAFTQFVPPGIAMDLMANSRGVAEFHTARRNVAMLTATIANFNGITEKQEPEHTAKMLKMWYEAFDAIVVKHRGTIVRFEGGAISIVFGDPIILDDPEIAASKCALAMRKYLENRKEHTLGFDCHVGIHAGTVMIGTMGTKSRMSYALCGGDSRVSDEIAEIGAFYGVSPVLTGTIREKVRESHTCILIDVVKLRGHMDKLTPIYHLVATNPPAEGPLANQVIAQATLYLDAIHKAVRVGDPAKARAIIGEMVQNSVFSSYVLALQMINAHIEDGSLNPASYAELGA